MLAVLAASAPVVATSTRSWIVAPIELAGPVLR